MKKTAAIWLSILLGLSLAGCSGNASAESVYKKAAESWSKKDAVEMNLTMNASVSQDGGAAQNGMTGVLKETGRNSEEGKERTILVEASMNLDMGTGSPMTIPISYAYAGGKLYVDMAGSRYQQSVTDAQLSAQVFHGLDLFSKLEAKEYRNMEIAEENGSYRITFGIGAEDVKKIAGSIPQIQEYRDTYGEGLTMNFADAEGTFEINEDHVPQKTTFRLKVDLSAEGLSASLVYDITEEYVNFGDKVTLTLPDFSGYEEVKVPEA
ncbi:hypothetical protein [Hominifimenecus sp. rT4P-3]|uniref:hypothetical protein n=1 Tax=Hominifimenecus sp. rT4P-3 TaxID=3242979 RepID=UPI003DA61681